VLPCPSLSPLSLTAQLRESQRKSQTLPFRDFHFSARALFCHRISPYSGGFKAWLAQLVTGKEYTSVNTKGTKSNVRADPDFQAVPRSVLLRVVLFGGSGLVNLFLRIPLSF